MKPIKIKDVYEQAGRLISVVLIAINIWFGFTAWRYAQKDTTFAAKLAMGGLVIYLGVTCIWRVDAHWKR